MQVSCFLLKVKKLKNQAKIHLNAQREHHPRAGGCSTDVPLEQGNSSLLSCASVSYTKSTHNPR